jgi:anti-sigma regulatory factor (Ser/Thr protein kinase)
MPDDRGMCSVTPPADLKLPTDEQAPGVARRFLRETSCLAHHARVMDEAELLVSELVTNAVVHGTPPVTVSVECDGSEGLRVAVTDGSSHSPVPREASPDDESGRGIHLVDVISDRWGVAPNRGDGKAVWFTLRG